MKAHQKHMVENWGKYTYCKLNLCTDVASTEYENKLMQLNKPLNRIMAWLYKNRVQIIAVYAEFKAQCYEN